MLDERLREVFLHLDEKPPSIIKIPTNINNTLENTIERGSETGPTQLNGPRRRKLTLEMFHFFSPDLKCGMKKNQCKDIVVVSLYDSSKLSD